MVRRTDPKDDNWQFVKDAKKRKQIQDRLAQRARRQRLREAKLNTTSRPHNTSTKRRGAPISPQSDSSHDNQLLITYNGPASIPSTSSTDLVDYSLENWDFSLKAENLPILDYDATTSDENLIDPTIYSAGVFASLPLPSEPSHHPTVFSALFRNGEILGIQCSMILSRSPSPKPSIPLSLHPTETQRLVDHPRWFDRFPFPKMRDSLIKLQGILDEDELIKDIYTMPSWTIVEGKAPWDPRAWKMEKEWSVKWGWLML